MREVNTSNPPTGPVRLRHEGVQQQLDDEEQCREPDSQCDQGDHRGPDACAAPWTWLRSLPRWGSMILGRHLRHRPPPDPVCRRRARSPFRRRLTAWSPRGMTAEPPSPSSTCHWPRCQASTGPPHPPLRPVCARSCALGTVDTARCSVAGRAAPVARYSFTGLVGSKRETLSS